MPTADELFARAVSTDSADEANRFLISEDLRTVTVPEGQKVLGSYHDDSVRRIWFDMPAECDGTDLSDFSVSVVYRNALGEENRCIVTDAAAAGSVLSFSWLVGRGAFAAAGTVLVSICLRKYEADGETVAKEFNTTTFKMTVLESLEAGAQSVMPYSDVVNALVTGWNAQIGEAVANAGESADAAHEAASAACSAASSANDAASAANSASTSATGAASAATAAASSAISAATAANNAESAARAASSAAADAAQAAIGAADSASSAAESAVSAAAGADASAAGANEAAARANEVAGDMEEATQGANDAADAAGAAANRANAAADAVDDAVAGDLGPLLDSYLEGRKDVAGGFVSYETHRQDMGSKINADAAGASGGVAQLDEGGKVPLSQLPDDMGREYATRAEVRARLYGEPSPDVEDYYDAISDDQIASSSDVRAAWNGEEVGEGSFDNVPAGVIATEAEVRDRFSSE